VEATIRQHCKTLWLSTIASQFIRLAGEAVKAKQSHTEYLEALLAAELEERERRTIERRIREAHLPRMKRLEDFNFSPRPTISAAQIRELARRRLYRPRGTGGADPQLSRDRRQDRLAGGEQTGRSLPSLLHCFEISPRSNVSLHA
jgi:hypothetical protein